MDEVLLVSSPPMSGFIRPGRLAAPALRNEAKTGSLALRLTCSPHQASSGRLLCRTLVWLLVERAIYKVNSFQFTRTARLILALQVISTLCPYYRYCDH